MIVRVEADTRNARRVLQQLERLRRSADASGYENLGGTTLFTRIGIQVLRWVDQNFLTGGAPVGGWRPLRPLTVFARRRGSDLPLSNTGALRRSFTFKALPAEVRVGTVGFLAQVARWQSEGTQPYDIYPRNKQALAFPAPPQAVYSMGVGFYARRVTVGRKGAAAPRASGVPRVGLTTPGQIRGMGYRVPAGRGSLQSFAVLAHVHHPGLPARRILPSAAETAAIIQPVVQDYFTNDVLRGQGT